MQISTAWWVRCHLHVWIFHILLYKVKNEGFHAAISFLGLQCFDMSCILLDAWSSQFPFVIYVYSPNLPSNQEWVKTSAAWFLSSLEKAWKQSSSHNHLLIFLTLVEDWSRKLCISTQFYHVRLASPCSRCRNTVLAIFRAVFFVDLHKEPPKKSNP